MVLTAHIAADKGVGNGTGGQRGWWKNGTGGATGETRAGELQHHGRQQYQVNASLSVDSLTFVDSAAYSASWLISALQLHPNHAALFAAAGVFVATLHNTCSRVLSTATAAFHTTCMNAAIRYVVDTYIAADGKAGDQAKAFWHGALQNATGCAREACACWDLLQQSTMRGSMAAAVLLP
jgi:hypothetical protein